MTRDHLLLLDAAIGALVAAAVGALVLGPALTAGPLVAALGLLALAGFAGTIRTIAERRRAWASVAVPTVSAVVCLPLVYRTDTATPQGILATAVVALVIVRLTTSLMQNRQLTTVVAQAAVTDALTGLANRDHLHQRLQEARARRGERVALLVLDVDDFKVVNDMHGHVVGDRVLIDVAQRLRRAIRRVPDRATDTVARLGGDEFVILLEGVDGPEGALAVAERALDELHTPLALDGRGIELEASVGITYADVDDDRAPAELLRDADTAMYEAKRAGKHRYEVFEPGMHAQLVTRNELVRDLRGAIERDELRLVYQPQYAVGTGLMTGVEALLRWDHPDRGLVTPDHFIPLAESSGLIVDIDGWVLKTACGQLRAWDALGLDELGMAVNVSSVTLEVIDLVATVRSELQAAGLSPARLEVEVTETAAVDQHDVAIAALDGLRALGVSVAIDDFGVGHSALSRLQSFPVDRLKIDRAFVAPLTSADAGGGSLVEAMVAMGHGLGLDVVAEGVETEEQLACLARFRCTTAQGYLFSKPVAPERIVQLVATAEALTMPVAPRRTPRERFVDSLLAELERTTGLESTYLTSIDERAGIQTILRSRNAGAIEMPAGLEVPWSDTLCRRALDQGIPYTSDVPGLWPDSEPARELGLRTYISVPIRGAGGGIEGTLCGASSAEVALGPEALDLMRHIADLIAAQDGSSTEPVA